MIIDYIDVQWCSSAKTHVFLGEPDPSTYSIWLVTWLINPTSGLSHVYIYIYICICKYIQMYIHAYIYIYTWFVTMVTNHFVGGILQYSTYIPLIFDDIRIIALVCRKVGKQFHEIMTILEITWNSWEKIRIFPIVPGRKFHMFHEILGTGALPHTGPAHTWQKGTTTTSALRDVLRSRQYRHAGEIQRKDSPGWIEYDGMFNKIPISQWGFSLESPYGGFPKIRPHRGMAVKACWGANSYTKCLVTFVNIAVAISALAGRGGAKTISHRDLVLVVFACFSTIFGCLSLRGYWNGILGHFGRLPAREERTEMKKHRK